MPHCMDTCLLQDVLNLMAHKAVELGLHGNPASSSPTASAKKQRRAG
jgi:hypothetical protein